MWLHVFLNVGIKPKAYQLRTSGVLKYVDVIGNVEYNGHFFENFFVEVSHGPFHLDSNQHIVDDNFKLAKLGKYSLDRNRGSITQDMIVLFHLHTKFLCIYLMDYNFFPLVRKIPLDIIQIPFFLMTPASN